MKYEALEEVNAAVEIGKRNGLNIKLYANTTAA